MTLQNTALINNYIGPVGGAPNCVALYGSQLISLGNNVLGDLTGCAITTLASDIVASDALLLPAANNGSGLLTMMPAHLSCSPE